MAAHATRDSVETLDHAEEHAGAAFDSFADGAHEIQLSAAGALPATGRFLGRIVYNTSYALSFGVTFPVMMVVRVVPKENPLVHGLVDGAMAARDQAFGWHHEMIEDHEDEEDHEEHALGNGTGHHDHDEAGDHESKPRRTRAKRATSGTTRKPTRTSSRKKG